MKAVSRKVVGAFGRGLAIMQELAFLQLDCPPAKSLSPLFVQRLTKFVGAVPLF